MNVDSMMLLGVDSRRPVRPGQRCRVEHKLIRGMKLEWITISEGVAAKMKRLEVETSDAHTTVRFGDHRSPQPSPLVGLRLPIYPAVRVRKGETVAFVMMVAKETRVVLTCSGPPLRRRR